MILFPIRRRALVSAATGRRQRWRNHACGKTCRRRSPSPVHSKLAMELRRVFNIGSDACSRTYR